MAEIIYMPKLSDTMTEGVVAEWHKKIGDTVANGELIAEIETDKATMEFESFYDGVLLHIGVEKSKAAPVNSILAIIGQAGEDISGLLSQQASSAVAIETPVVETVVPSEAPVVVSPVERPSVVAPVAPVTTNSAHVTSDGRVFTSSPI